MRKFENQVQLIKYEILKEVSRFTYEGKLNQMVNEIPYIVDPGPEPRYRCCLYHERAITADRVKMAMGGDKNNPNIIEVLDTACDQCPVNRYVITETCRGCLAHRCESACPVNAITITDHRAVIDYSKCIECGRCKNACPYNAIADVMRPCRRACPTGAIEINDNKKAVINNDKCIQCGACVYQCPFGAIQDKSQIVEVINLLKEAEKSNEIHPYAIIAPAFASQFEYANLGQIIRGIKLLGFKDVIEVALGADMISEHETLELVEHLKDHSFMTSSCCPAFVKYIENEYPEVTENISNSVSPMIATSKLIKSIDDKAVVVFIGPCVAKKAEKDLPKLSGITDYVLTFEELVAMIDSRGIKLETLEEASLNNASYFGRMFASTGGLSKSITEVVKKKKLDIDVVPVICDGIKECDKALKIAKMDRLKGNFIEGMACVGGCIKGPVTMHHGTKDVKKLENYCSSTIEKDSKESLRIFDVTNIDLNKK